MSGMYIGYDPGGGGAHGVAVISEDVFLCETKSTAEAAIEWFCAQCAGSTPVAMGVDTLTLWSTGPAGWRPADRALRAAYPTVANSVTAPNSLYGSMPLNGAAVCLALLQQFPDLRITETHPKVLYYALTKSDYDFVTSRERMCQELVEMIGCSKCNIGLEHSWDALISSYAAREWGNERWVADLHALETQPGERLVSPLLSKTAYAWPESLPAVTVTQLLQPQRTRQRPDNRSNRDRWRVAVDILSQAGHDDVAQQIELYRNARNERSGWDSWLKSNYPALWPLVENSRDQMS